MKADRVGRWNAFGPGCSVREDSSRSVLSMKRNANLTILAF